MAKHKKKSQKQKVEDTLNSILLIVSILLSLTYAFLSDEIPEDCILELVRIIISMTKNSVIRYFKRLKKKKQ